MKYESVDKIRADIAALVACKQRMVAAVEYAQRVGELRKRRIAAAKRAAK